MLKYQYVGSECVIINFLFLKSCPHPLALIYKKNYGLKFIFKSYFIPIDKIYFSIKAFIDIFRITFILKNVIVTLHLNAIFID